MAVKPPRCTSCSDVTLHKYPHQRQNVVCRGLVGFTPAVNGGILSSKKDENRRTTFHTSHGQSVTHGPPVGQSDGARCPTFAPDQWHRNARASPTERRRDAWSPGWGEAGRHRIITNPTSWYSRGGSRCVACQEGRPYGVRSRLPHPTLLATSDSVNRRRHRDPRVRPASHRSGRRAPRRRPV